MIDSTNPMKEVPEVAFLKKEGVEAPSTPAYAGNMSSRS